MRKGTRDDKNATESQQESEQQNNYYEKDRKIKRLTQINRELIETLKQQNQELTKKIQKQKLRSGRSSSVKSVPKNTKQLESIRKELSNAYKQIDMYKETVLNLKAKEVPLDHVDKIKQLENKVKQEDSIIENYQKQIKYLINLKEKQDKQLKMFENEEVKMNKIALQKEIATMKQKIKSLKKNATKREQIQKRQHAYFVQLEKSSRKLNDQYYPGKQEPKKQREQEQVSEKDWVNVKTKLVELRKIYEENNKKLDTINRQKLRELKSYEQNELKLKQKTRKLNMLRSRIAQLTKLTVLKQQPKQFKQQTVFLKKQQVKNDKNKIEQRQIKKWNVPQTFCMQQGKVLPNSFFSSDKQILGLQHKYKIIRANVYVNSSGAPCLLHFIYQNQEQEEVEGRDMVQNIPHNLQLKSFILKEKDYIFSIAGSFKQGILNSISFRSKLGSEIQFEDDSSKGGEVFNFHRQSGDIPSCFYGATIITNTNQNQIKICYLGFQFMQDW